MLVNEVWLIDRYPKILIKESCPQTAADSRGGYTEITAGARCYFSIFMQDLERNINHGSYILCVTGILAKWGITNGSG